jgi:hypothetical protein
MVWSINNFDIYSLSIFDNENNYSDMSKQEFATLTLKSYNPLNVNKLGYGYFGGESGDILIDPKHKYIINKYGYRGSEFLNQADILFAGCSQTFGIGMPEEMIWGNQLGKFLNKSVANISKPGASVQWIVQKIFAYCQEFENPKYITCLFPDFFRMLAPKSYPSKNDNNILTPLILKNFIDSKQKFSKRPHRLEQVLELDFALYLSIQYINMLEQYCKSNNIKLYWSCWHKETTDIIKKLQNEYSSFIFYNDSYIYGNFKLDCHPEISKKYAHCFDIGGDIELSYDRAHLGVHAHTHIAEYFKDLILETA